MRLILELQKIIDKDILLKLSEIITIEKMMKRKYLSIENMFKYVSDDLKEKFHTQKKALYTSLESNNKERILKLGSATIRGWSAVDYEAEKNGAPLVDLELWQTTHPLFPEVKINVTRTQWTKKRTKGEVWVSIDELIPFISPIIKKVKETFPDSKIERVSYDDEIPF